MLFRSILFVAIPFKFSKAMVDFDTKAHLAMLHSTRQLTVEDVQAMSLFRDVYRMKEASDPKIGSSLREFISNDALGLATNDYFVNHGLAVRYQSGSTAVFVEVVGDTIDDIQEVLSTNGLVQLNATNTAAFCTFLLMRLMH